ncbi:hypothetical protein [Thioalkalivibrio sp. HK1]|uniref:hypothetical protein n=1 Tax=Thioalkalivibrio sp. HK1 TaxID=1469245 RepID=UPI0018CC62F8|nr:hypothetical protein [Thioalkalivibrio sp. HK1]
MDRSVHRLMIGVIAAALIVSILFAPSAKARTRHIGLGWWYGETIDPVTRQGTSFIARAAKGHLDNGSGAGLMIVCQSDVKTLGLAIDWNEFIGSGGFVEVVLQVDERASITSPSWYVDRSTSSIFDEGAQEIVNEMRQGKRTMHARIDDEGGKTHALAFDLSGFEEAILQVSGHCKD